MFGFQIWYYLLDYIFQFCFIYWIPFSSFILFTWFHFPDLYYLLDSIFQYFFIYCSTFSSFYYLLNNIPVLYYFESTKNRGFLRYIYNRKLGKTILTYFYSFDLIVQLGTFKVLEVSLTTQYKWNGANKFALLVIWMFHFLFGCWQFDNNGWIFRFKSK